MKNSILCLCILISVTAVQAAAFTDGNERTETGSNRAIINTPQHQSIINQLLSREINSNFQPVGLSILLISSFPEEQMRRWKNTYIKYFSEKTPREEARLICLATDFTQCAKIHPSEFYNFLVLFEKLESIDKADEALAKKYSIRKSHILAAAFGFGFANNRVVTAEEALEAFSRNIISAMYV